MYAHDSVIAKSADEARLLTIMSPEMIVVSYAFGEL